jgi:hypothetical protein
MATTYEEEKKTGTFRSQGLGASHDFLVVLFIPRRRTRALRAGLALVKCMRQIIGEVRTREKERVVGGETEGWWI